MSVLSRLQSFLLVKSIAYKWLLSGRLVLHRFNGHVVTVRRPVFRRRRDLYSNQLQFQDQPVRLSWAWLIDFSSCNRIDKRHIVTLMSDVVSSGLVLRHTFKTLIWTVRKFINAPNCDSSAHQGIQYSAHWMGPNCHWSCQVTAVFCIRFFFLNIRLLSPKIGIALQKVVNRVEVRHVEGSAHNVKSNK